MSDYDLEKLSDSELMAFINQGAPKTTKNMPAQTSDINNLNDSELMEFINQNAPRGTLGELGHKGRLVGQEFSKGALGVADLPFNLPLNDNDAGNPMAKMLEPELPLEQQQQLLGRKAPKSPQESQEELKFLKELLPSTYAQKFLKDKFGLDLDAEKAESKLDEYLGTGARVAGAVAGGKGLGAGAKLGKAALLGRPSLEAAKAMFTAPAIANAAKQIGLGGVSGIGSQGLQDLGVNPAVAHVGSGLLTGLAAEGYRRARTPYYKRPEVTPPPQGTPYTYTPGEMAITKRLAGKLEERPRTEGHYTPGNTELQNIVEDIQNKKQIPYYNTNTKKPDVYNPTTAETTTNPLLAQLERTGKVSGHNFVVNKTGELHQAISSVLDEMFPGQFEAADTQNFFNKLQKYGEKKAADVKAERDQSIATLEEYKGKKSANLENKLTKKTSALEENRAREIADIENKLATQTNDILNSEFGNQLSTQEAGKVVREGIYSDLSKFKKERKRIGQPLYDAIDEIHDAIPINNTMSTIESKNSAPSVDLEYKNMINNVKKRIYSDKDNAEYNNAVAAWNEFEKTTGKNLSPEVLNKTREEFFSTQPIKNTDKLPVTLTTARRHINKKVRELLAKDVPDREGAKHLIDIRSAIEKDLSVLPDWQKADAIWADLSKPISAIERNPIYKKMLKRDKATRDFYNPYTSEIPEQFMASEEIAKDFLTKTKNLPETRVAMQRSINKSFIDAVADEYGNVTDMKKVNKWLASMKKNSPGAFLIDPNLATKTKNLLNVHVYANKIKKDINTSYKEATQKIMDAHKEEVQKIMSGNKSTIQKIMNASKEELNKIGKTYGNESIKYVTKTDPDQIVASMFTGSQRARKTNAIVKIANKDKSGAALEGLRQSGIKYLKNQITLSGSNSKGFNSLSYDKMRRFMAKNEAALNELYTPQQVQTLKFLEQSLFNQNRVETQGKGGGSDTFTKYGMERFIDTSLLNLPEAGWTLKVIDKVLNASLGPFSWIRRKYNATKETLIAMHHFGQEAKREDVYRLLEKLLNDSDYAEFMFTKVDDILKNPEKFARTKRLYEKIKAKAYTFKDTAEATIKKPSTHALLYAAATQTSKPKEDEQK